MRNEAKTEERIKPHTEGTETRSFLCSQRASCARRRGHRDGGGEGGNRRRGAEGILGMRKKEGGIGKGG